jgi:uncharacterized protein YbjQ (UPF0145 family)
VQPSGIEVPQSWSAVTVVSRLGVPCQGLVTSPFTANMSGQEFALLCRAGYLPLGIVMGVCVFHVGRRSVAQALRSLPRNSELLVITEALYESHELAMSRMQEEALALGAHGVVGIDIDHQTHAWGRRVMEFRAIGTAMELVAEDYQSLEPKLLVSLGSTPASVIFAKGSSRLGTLMS